MLHLIRRVIGSRISSATNKCNVAFVSTNESLTDTSEASDSTISEIQLEPSAESMLKMDMKRTIDSQLRTQSNRITIDGYLFSSCMYRKDDSGAIQFATFQLKHHGLDDGAQQDMFTVKLRKPRTILYALNKLNAGSKVRVKGYLGLRNSDGEIAIIANHVLNLDTPESNVKES